MNELYTMAEKVNFTKEEIDKMVAEESSNDKVGHLSTDKDKELLTYYLVRRKLKKISMKAPIELSGYVIGDKLTDFGQIMRRKFNGDKRPDGSYIPEHDYTREIFILSDGTIKTISQKSQDEITYPPTFNSVCEAKFKVIQNTYNGKVYYNWDDEISKVDITKEELTYQGFSDLIQEKQTLNKLIIPNLSELMKPQMQQRIINTQNGLLLFKGSVMEMNIFNSGQGVAQVDDDSLDMTQIIPVRFEKAVFTDTARDIIFFAQMYIKDGNPQINQCMAVPRPEDKVVETEEIIEDDLKEQEVNAFL